MKGFEQTAKETLETLAEIIKDKGVKIDISGDGEWRACKRRYLRRREKCKE